MAFPVRNIVPFLAAFLSVAPSIRAQTAVHPGFTITSLRPPGFNPMVGGLDFLPDGRLVVVTWEGFGRGKGSVYLVSNAQTGDASKVTYVKYASGLNEPLGVKVVDGKIYVLEKDQLSWLPDANGDGKADTVLKVASGWTVQPGTGANLEFALGLVYKDSAFYAGLATNWPLNATQSNERGCILRIPMKGAWENFACGVRTPNGFVLGPEDEIFTTENQGNWVPSSKLLHIVKGHFYGVHKTQPGPFDQVPETPPALWMDHGNISVSPTQPVYLKSGPFQGQMIAGDNHFGTLQRYFLEKVGGEWQGAVFRFSAGLEAAANRIVTGPDGAVYVGGIGTQEWGGWDWNGKNFGLQRLTPNGKSFFDMLAVRSLGANKLEIEFTAPAGSAAGATSHYSVQQWSYVPQLSYGAGKQPVENLTVQSVELSADKRKAVLQIGGMQLRHVVYLKLSGIASETGENLWGTEAWYTQNAFGPAAPPVAVRSAPAPATRFSVRPAAAGRWTIAIADAGRFTLDILDPEGRRLETRSGMGPGEFTTRGAYAGGMVVAKVRSANGSATRLLCAGQP